MQIRILLLRYIPRSARYRATVFTVSGTLETSAPSASRSITRLRATRLAFLLPRQSSPPRDSQASAFERRHPASVYRERRVNEHNGIRARPFSGDNNRQCARLALLPSFATSQRVCMHAHARACARV